MRKSKSTVDQASLAIALALLEDAVVSWRLEGSPIADPAGFTKISLLTGAVTLGPSPRPRAGAAVHSVFSQA